MAPTTLEVPARKRTVRACDQCRRRKVKCNGKLGCTECNSIGLECSYGSQIKQSRRRNYLIHLEQKVQRLEHELRTARTTRLSDPAQRRPSDTPTEHSIAGCSNPGVQDCNSVAPDLSANSIRYWNNTYKPFEQHSGGQEWVGPVTTKPFLSGLTIPTQCLQSSDYIYRADSLSPQTPQTASSATWTPCSGEVIDYWRTIPDNNCAQAILPTMPQQDPGRWYNNSYDQHIDVSNYQGLAYTNGNLATCPPSYN
ncbi:putative zn(2)-C6 fungal-type DNA-binding domain-containing protein [Septoria linicola]|nr:putative zn(2)-C6 fungal-type DNA-binding domain-containing protein [Septoria linicola]